MKFSAGLTLILCSSLLTSSCRLKIESFSKKTPKSEEVELPNINWPALRLVSATNSISGGVPFIFFGKNTSFQNKLLFVSERALVPEDTQVYQDIYMIDLVTKEISLVSSDSNGQPGNFKAGENNFFFSPDGSHVLFMSGSSNLVAGDTNGFSDLFLKDLTTGSVLRINTASDGSEIPSGCPGKEPHMSPDGHNVAFMMDTTGCDGNSFVDVYVKNLQTGELHRLTHGSDNVYVNGFSADGSRIFVQSGNHSYYINAPFDGTSPMQKIGVNGDGDDFSTSYSGQLFGSSSFIFSTVADNVLSNDQNNSFDVFIKDLQTQTIERLSTNLAGDWANLSVWFDMVSSDGRYVVMSSNDNPVFDLSDTNGVNDIYIKDRQTGNLSFLSAYGFLNPGQQAYNTSPHRISPDGTKLVIQYLGETATAGVLRNDYYFVDLATKSINPVAINSNSQGTRTLSVGIDELIFSPDSTKVYFLSTADDLVPGDDNKALDLFVKTISTGAIERIEFPTIGDLKASDNHVDESTSIASGKIAFSSPATNLEPQGGNGYRQLYLHDVQTGTLTIESLGTDGSLGNADSGYPHLSRDGKKLLFSSYAGNLITGDTNNVSDIFLKDLTTGALTLVSVTADGTQTDADSKESVLSSDGMKVYFVSYASNLVSGDTNNDKDIFEKNLRTGVVRRITTQAEGMKLSKDGKKLVYQSWRDTGSGAKVSLFVQDLETGHETLVSTNTDGSPLMLWSLFGDFSPSGDQVAFTHLDIDATDDGDFSSVKSFIKNLSTGELTRIDLKPDQTPYDGYTALPKFGPEGKYIYFASTSTELTADTSAGTPQIYQKDLITGVVTKVSTNLDGEEADGRLNFVFDLSSDGKALIFVGELNNLVPHDQPGVSQLFVKRVRD